MLQNEKFILVDNEEALSGLLQDLDQHEMAAVDTEADSMHHYLARLCLIQITIGDHHYIVDPLCGLDISPLFKAKAMQTLELKKENQRADWTTRPLPLEMCEYAIHDTFYLHELCAILVEKLQKAGRLAWLTEQCDALIEHSRQPSLIKKDPWRIPGSSLFDPCTLNLLKHIWEWREKEAEALDRPPYKVMPAELMLAIVRSLRTQFPEVDKDRMPKLPRNFKGERLDSFIQMFKTAVTVPESEWPEKLPKAPPPPVVPHSDLLIALKIWRDEEAEKLKLDPSLIANKGQLIWLAAPGSMPWETRYEEAHLMRWQKNIWNNILQEHLPTAKRIGED